MCMLVLVVVLCAWWLVLPIQDTSTGYKHRILHVKTNKYTSSLILKLSVKQACSLLLFEAFTTVIT